MAESDTDISGDRQPLPPLTRDALHRIEKAEQAARERYDRDGERYFPVHPAYSFIEADILRSKERVLEYVRLFAEEVLEAYLREYLESAPLDLLTNEALLASLATTVLTLTDELWKGYNCVLFLEPNTRRARFQQFMTLSAAERAGEPRPELETWRYPEADQWAETWAKLTERDSRFSQLSARFAKTIEKVIGDGIKRFQREAASRLGRTPTRAPQAEAERAETTVSNSPAESTPKSQTTQPAEGAPPASPGFAEESRASRRGTQSDLVQVLSQDRLSNRDANVHDIVGEENFRTLRNAEIMKVRGVKIRLRKECGLEQGDAAKRSFDRIREAKGYPLSREIAKKRSGQK